MFIESVDASSYSHTGEKMFILFERFIQKVGPENVVQIVTDSASNNKYAGQLVEEKYPHIYWTPCAAHCIDLMFEDIFKLDHLKKVLEKAIAINSYILKPHAALELDERVHRAKGYGEASKDSICHRFHHIELL